MYKKRFLFCNKFYGFLTHKYLSQPFTIFLIGSGKSISANMKKKNKWPVEKNMKYSNKYSKHIFGNLFECILWICFCCLPIPTKKSYSLTFAKFVRLFAWAVVTKPLVVYAKTQEKREFRCLRAVTAIDFSVIIFIVVIETVDNIVFKQNTNNAIVKIKHVRGPGTWTI